MSKTENDIDIIGEMMKKVISEKSMDSAYESLVSIPEMKAVIDFHGQKILTEVVRELFKTYRANIQGVSFDEIAGMLISGKVTIPQILGKIKTAVIASLKKKDSLQATISDEELAKQLSEELAPDKADEKKTRTERKTAPINKKASSAVAADIADVAETEQPQPEQAPETAEPAPAVAEPEPAAQAPEPARASPAPAESDPLEAFKTAVHGKISDDHAALFVKMGETVRDKFLKDGDFLAYWNEITGFMTGDGAKMMNEWRGTTPEFLVISCGYVFMKKLFKGSKTVKVSKIEFHGAFNVDPRSCFRAMFKVNEYLGISE